MYKNEKLLIGKNEEKETYIIPKMANRHGLITGASGSGKTVTLKVMAESFSEASVPVFLVDIKGDLSATSMAGKSNENVDSRVKKLGLDDFKFRYYPVTYLDVYGKNGHPIRTTVSNIGSRLFAKMLNLTDAQEGVLAIVFKIAEDEQKEMVDLKDFKSMLTYVGEKRQEYSLKYGNISLQSITSIQRNLLVLESDGGDDFFGLPAFNIKDLIHYDEEDGRGFINILDAVTLFKKPTLYSTFLLWLLNEIYDTMPEVGDLDKPKLVLFFDEAHVLFSDMPDYLIKQIIQIVKLIRSKGIGLYFISQTPSDIPDEILSQLGNRVQHVLRSYTKSDDKIIKAAADSFRANPLFDTEEVLRNLATGEALVSFQNENGEPTIVERVTILPPQSRMGIIEDDIRQNMIKKSFLYNKYEQKIETESAFEKISKANEKQQETPVEVEAKTETEKKKETKKKKSHADKVINKIETRVINKTVDKLFKLFK